MFGGETNEVIDMDLSKLHSFKNHPFKVTDDKKMAELVESIKNYGVLVPAIVRVSSNDTYEIVSGHRRKRACELAGLNKMPVIIKEYTDDEAIIAMIDSNLQRESILPSERAYAYKMKFEAMTHQGKKDESNTSTQVGWKSETATIIGKLLGDSKNQVRRYIRLTELNSELINLVDIGKLKFNPAVELSYLTDEQQMILIKVMNSEHIIPSLSQAEQLKELSRETFFSQEAVQRILSSFKQVKRTITIRQDIIKRYFPSKTSDEEIKRIICLLLDEWKQKGGEANES